MKRIEVSAPGKLMLFGEHAVVFDEPCLVTAVDRRLKLTLEQSDAAGEGFLAPGVGDTRFLEGAIKSVKSAFKVNTGKLKITTRCGFSGKYGFGSSSAVTSAMVKALSEMFTLKLDTRQLFELAYRTVLEVQGVGSGFDVATGIYGGTLFYKKGGQVLEELPDYLNDAVIVVGYSGVKSHTVDLVRQVAGKRAQSPEKFRRIMEAIGKLVLDARKKILEKDWERVGKLMDYNQEYLRDLGVSSEKLENLIFAAKKNGAWGAKLSGAGGGDCMFAIAPKEKKAEIEASITAAGGEVVMVNLNAEGVRIETTDDQQEEFVVVDGNDRVIGYRTRSECHHNKQFMHRSVGTVIFNDNNDILLLKRSPTKDLQPEFWDSSSAGHVNRGESYEQAAKRELKEELGIEVPVTFHSKKLFTDDRESEMQVLFIARHNGPFKLNEEEIDRAEFVSHTDLIDKYRKKEILLSSWAENDLKTLKLI